MLFASLRLPCFHAVLLLSVLRFDAATGSLSGTDSHARDDALGKFFDSIDKDGNGQIEVKEASQYIGANFDGDMAANPARAAQQMSKNLDSNDADKTISKEEVEKHLKKLLKGSRLSEWLKHAVQMPQYVETFKRNAITSLDFPSLIADGGSLLEAELGIKSKLHKEQIIRAMKRLVLGLGEPPSKPEKFEVHATQCDAVSLTWQAPASSGQPHLHKLRLERSKLGSPHNSRVPIWEAVNEDLDDDTHSFTDTGIEAGTYRYRLTAWNIVGWSESAISSDCNTKARGLPCPPGKCWKHGTCKKQPASNAAPSSAHERPRLSLGGWRLVCSLLGVLLLGYSLVVFSTGKQFWQEFLDGLGLSGLLSASPLSERPQHPSNPESNTTTNDQPPRPPPSSRSFSEQLAVRDETQNPLHVYTDVRRGPFKPGQLRTSSPSKKAWNPPSRSDFFSAGDIASFKGLTPQQSKSPSASAAAGNGAPLMSSTQQVLWLNDEGQEVEPPPALDIPPSPKDIGRHGCAYPTCDKGLHPIFNPRSAMTSHYCSICQSVFCHRHTRYSPHGKLGSCGMESKCICQLCFDDLPRITQERLERTNRLQQKPKKEAGVQASGGSASSREKDSRRKSMSAQYGSAQSLATSVDSPNGRDEVALLRLSSSERRGAQNWTKLRTAWRAMVLFQGAGNERRRRTDRDREIPRVWEKSARKTQ